jgi:hypothetical protein
MGNLSGTGHPLSSLAGGDDRRAKRITPLTPLLTFTSDGRSPQNAQGLVFGLAFLQEDLKLS